MSIKQVLLLLLSVFVIGSFGKYYAKTTYLDLGCTQPYKTEYVLTGTCLYNSQYDYYYSIDCGTDSFSTNSYCPNNTCTMCSSGGGGNLPTCGDTYPNQGYSASCTDNVTIPSFDSLGTYTFSSSDCSGSYTTVTFVATELCNAGSANTSLTCSDATNEMNTTTCSDSTCSSNCNIQTTYNINICQTTATGSQTQLCIIPPQPTKPSSSPSSSPGSNPGSSPSSSPVSIPHSSYSSSSQPSSSPQPSSDPDDSTAGTISLIPSLVLFTITWVYQA